MGSEFESCVDYGLRLSKRVYYGKEAAPVTVPSMSRSSSERYLPTGVMAYAVVPQPEVVDNPDVPSYQPYVHGGCDPPALIPLHMHGVGMEVDCCLDYATVCFGGTWRLHCIKAGSKCDCRIAVPLADQGSLLGVEVEVPGRSYHSQLMTVEDAKDIETSSKLDGQYLKGYIYSFKIPEVEGGSSFSVKVTWSQRLTYQDGQFCINVPFSFPAYVNPIGRKISKREKILLNVNAGIVKEILCKSSSHALKELRREVGKMGFFYEAEVSTWSSADFSFSYSVPSKDLFGGVLLQTPLLRNFDETQMFCLYLFPGDDCRKKAFRKEVVFLIDKSGSMREGPLESAKSAVLSSLSTLNPQDSFNIIAFNSESTSFSSLMEPATRAAITKATQWLSDNLIADGGTNISLPLKQAMRLLAETTDSIPLIFLITDGTVEDERDICTFVKDSVKCGGSMSPRICTFGIGTNCNHYFLQMLAENGRGRYDSAYDADSVGIRLQRFFTTASNVSLANITMDGLEHLNSLELLPCTTPDMSSGSPLIVAGRYSGNFPDSVLITGTLADGENFKVHLKARRTKDVPLDRVLARRQIDGLTANAWLSGSKDLEQKVAKLGIQTGVSSEYTRMILIQTDTGKKAPETTMIQEIDIHNIRLGDESMNLDVCVVTTKCCRTVDSGSQNIILASPGVGFGNLTATAKNIPPGTEETKLEATEKLLNAATNCCGKVLDRVCCMCCIQACSSVSNQCSIVLTELCAALACFGCLSCCYELCACV